MTDDFLFSFNLSFKYARGQKDTSIFVLIMCSRTKVQQFYFDIVTEDSFRPNEIMMKVDSFLCAVRIINCYQLLESQLLYKPCNNKTCIEIVESDSISILKK